MAAVTLSMSVASPVRAAAPRVQVDETMYVNMDYYGNMTTVNVVKGCSTNGVERYTDYGVYDKVVNMTDKTEPELGDGSVTWQLPEGSKRFYYQCTMPDGTTELQSCPAHPVLWKLMSRHLTTRRPGLITRII